MADQYQLPGEFRPQDMSAISYKSGDTVSVDRENANNFLRQWKEATNITNADRAQSLREKEFQNLVVRNDRDFDLRREKQDQDIRTGDLDFELKKFKYDSDKKSFNQLEETWAKKDEIIGALEAFSPNGGNAQEYPQARVRVFKMFANNPNAYKIVQGILGPYDEQYGVFKANKYSEDAVEVQGAFDEGVLDEVLIGSTPAPEYWRNARLNQNDDPDGYAVAIRVIKRKVNEMRTAEAEGKFEAQNFAEGNIVTREMKLPDGTTLKSTAPRVFAPSRTGAGTSTGVKTYEKADIEFLKGQIKSVDGLIVDKKAELEGAESSVAKAGIKSDLDGLIAKQASLQKTLDMGVQLLEQKAVSQLPQTTGQPQVTPAGATKKRTLQPPSFPVPTTTPKPQTSASPISSTATGRFDKAAQAAGRRVYSAPVVANPFGAPVTSEGLKASVSG
jgi:hypothetical protein